VREQLELRLKELTSEYQSGQEMLADLEAKRADLQQTLLRIGGAIQVLTELLDGSPDRTGSRPPEPSSTPSEPS
jgi:predicted nuclease with TOPRIM domain